MEQERITKNSEDNNGPSLFITRVEEMPDQKFVSYCEWFYINWTKLYVLWLEIKGTVYFQRIIYLTMIIIALNVNWYTL